jgi:hypothetical protein
MRRNLHVDTRQRIYSGAMGLLTRVNDYVSAAIYVFPFGNSMSSIAGSIFPRGNDPGATAMGIFPCGNDPIANAIRMFPFSDKKHIVCS